MLRFSTKRRAAVGLFTILASVGAIASAPAATISGGDLLPSGDEILLRGPIHEGFAHFVPLDPQPGIAVVATPPAPLIEIPPEVKPAGQQYIWLPGYWAWDAGRSDFLWVSGVWRLPPPGRTWVPGHWTRLGQGWQWLAGYWEPVENIATVYLPLPPATRESGPTSAQPAPDDFWTPGVWRWQDGNFVWLAGRWMRHVAGRVWIPPHYAWCPAGAVFLSGYWDFPFTARGLLFAPVYFKDRSLLGVHASYAPEVLLDPAVVQNFLFCQPRYGQYWFGDYFESAYAQLGIFPWFSVAVNRFGTSPIFVYASWMNNQQQPGWTPRIGQWYADLSANPGRRPPQTFSDLRALHERKGDQAAGVAGLATPIADLLSDRNFSPPLVVMDDATRTRIRPLTEQVRVQMEERTRREIASRDAIAPSQTPVVLDSRIFAFPTSGTTILNARSPGTAALPPPPRAATGPGILR